MHVSNTHNRIQVNFVSGSGPYLKEGSGKQFLDFGSGIAVTSLGHSHPELVETLQSQAAKLWHISNLYTLEQTQQLAQQLCEKSTFGRNVFFSNSGSEANETCIKAMRRHFFLQGKPNRHRIICFENSFHGRSLACIAAAGNATYMEGFAPNLEGFTQLEYINLEAIKKELEKGDVAGILLEPIQGEGGVNHVGFEVMAKLRQLCDEYEAILALDEVQTGYTRTGLLFAFMHSGIKPDIISIAKAMGNGFPIAGTIFGEKVAQAFSPGTHGTTYGGGPIASAVGLKVLELTSKPQFIEHVKHVSTLLDESLANIISKSNGVFTEKRGFGALLGLKLRPDINPTDICIAAFNEGLLVTQTRNNVLRLTPPLIINQGHISEFEAKLLSAIRHYL